MGDEEFANEWIEKAVDYLMSKGFDGGDQTHALAESIYENCLDDNIMYCTPVEGVDEELTYWDSFL